MKLIYSILAFTLLSITSYSQAPANDACAGAIDLGSLDPDSGCNGANDGSTTGVTSVSGTNVDATAENPYGTVVGCNAIGTDAGDMATPSADVWYSFTPTSNHVQIDISGLANPNIGLYSGADCNSLQPEGCGIGTGASSFTFEQINAGVTYYIQISGGDLTDQAAFNMDISNYTDCGDCIIESNMVVNPLPTNGVYQPNTTVNFCYTIDGYVQQNTNWFHGVEPQFASGWDISTLTPTTIPPSECSSGDWGWYTSITSSATGNTAGAGFYYDTGGDGNPGNNFGDGGTAACSENASWTFCWDITTVGCTPGDNNIELTVDVLNFGDGEIGSWSDVGCTDDPPFNLNAALSCCDFPTLSQTEVTCFGLCDGSATVMGDGTAPYDYVWTDVATGNTVYTDNSNNGSSTYSALCAGNYTVSVTDDNGCEQVIGLTITEPDAIVLSEVHTDVQCFGACDGTGTVSVTSGGTGAFTYDWAGAGDSPTADSNTGLCAGTHTVTVTDANGCTETINVIIIEPAQIVLTEVHTDVTCNGLCDGTGTVSVTSGGTAPFTYDWASAGDSPTADANTGLCAGTHTVTVTDANGCTETINVIITEPLPIVLAEVHTDALCNGVCDGTGTVSVTSGGTAPYTYDWAGAGDSPTADANTGLCAGTHTVTVTDANGCTETIDVVIAEPLPIVLTEVHTDVSCNGICDATGTVSVSSGGTAPFTYDWAGNGDTPTTDANTGLCAGTITVTVTDANGCSETIDVTIVEPAILVLSEIHTDVICNGDCDGTGTVSVTSGGTAPFSYDWAGNGDTPTADVNTGLCAGTFTVTVTDANGCSETIDVIIIEPTLLVLTTSNTPSSCGASDGSVTVTPSGGSGTYTYSWEDASPAVVSTTATASGLPAGTYTVTVNDGNCTEVITATISDQGGPTVTVDATTDASCFGVCDGTAAITVTGGTGGNTITWPGGMTVAGDDLSAADICAGTYTISVADANACISTIDFTINEPVVLALTETHVDVLCNADCIGSIDVTPTGGTTPYSYAWASGETTEDLSGLCGGTYDLIVTDANGCTETISVTITEPTALTLAVVGTDSSAPNANDGSADGTTSGGTAPYTYLWDSGETTEDISGLAPGTYCLTVTDANGCTATECVIITEPMDIDITLVGVDITCFNACNGSVNLTINSPGSFTTTWTVTGGTIAGDNMSITDLCPQTVSVLVTDPVTGDFATASVVLAEPAEIILSETHTDALCNGICDGTGDVTVTSGGTAPFTYDWAGIGNTPTTSSNTGLCPGTHTVTVTDANGCIATIEVVITEPLAITITETHTDITCFGICDGTIDTDATGGTAPYSYDWAGIGDDPTLASNTGFCAGTYTVTVTDANGCIETLDITLIEPTQIVITPSSTPANCGQPDGTATADVTGGTAPYSYLWDNGTTTATCPNLIPGNYCVTVTDANGCIETICVDVDNITSGTIDIINIVNVSCFGLCDASAEIELTGGAAPFTYTLDGNPTPSTMLTGLCVGNHTVTVTDNVGCVATIDFDITEPEQLVLAETHTDVLCFSACDGTIDVTTTGGTLPYSYSWDTGETTEDLNSVCAGNYVLTVTDANGCTETINVAITEPTELVLATTAFDASCNGTCDGQVIVIPSGGTNNGGSYTIDWTNNGSSISSNASVNDLCAGTYDVSVTDDNGCIATAQEIINEPTPIILVLTQDSAHCNMADGATYVTASGGSGGYTYSWADNTGTVVSISDNAIDLIPGNYCVTVTDVNGCITIECIDVENIQGPVATIDNVDNTSCFESCDGEILIGMTGGSSTLFSYGYSFNGGAPVATSNPIPDLCAGNYDIIVVDEFGCTALQNTIVTEPTPVSVQAFNDTTICIGGCADLSALASGGTGTYTYNWGADGTTQNINVCPQNEGSYSVIATDVNGCTSPSASVNVSINPPLLIDLSTLGSAYVCPGETVDIDATVSGGSGSGYSISWDPIPDNGIDPQAAPVTYTPNGDMTITASVSDNCETPDATSTINIGNYVIPVISFTPDNPDGCQPHTTGFTTDITPSPASMIWDFGDISSGSDNTSTLFTPSHTYNDAGLYDISLVITTTDGCVDSLTESQMVEVYENPIADFTFGPQPTTILIPDVTFDGSLSYIADQYDWYLDGSTSTFGDGTTTMLSFETPGTFEVMLEVTTVNGCTDSLIQTVIIDPEFTLFVPNGFTPDGDGVNDSFKPLGIGIDYENYDFWIYDRWGNMIFHTTDYYSAWDGKVHECATCPSQSQRSEAQIDVYVWVVKTNDLNGPIKRVGHVSIIR